MSDYSLELNEDQIQIIKWVHEFAENVVRPAGPEWDEREETPWPIIEEAAKNGLYSFDFIAQAFSDPTGLLMCLVNEEMSWGDAGIALAIFGSTLAVAGIFANGTPEQIGEWIPQCFGTPDDIKLAAFGVSEPDAGSDVSSLKSRAVYDEAKDEWVLNGTKTWITNGGIANTHVLVLSVDPALGCRGQASFVVPEGTKGISQGQKFKKMGIRASHTAEVILDDCRVPGRCLLGGKEKLDERLARAKEGKRTSTQAAMATFEASRPIVGAQAVGIARAAYEFSLDYAKERKQFGRAIIENQAIAFKLADMKMHTDAVSLAGASCGVDGLDGQEVRERRGFHVEALRRRERRVGHRAGHPDSRWLRLRPGEPGRAVAPRLEDLHDLRGDLGGPAARDQPGHLGHPHQLIRSIRPGQCTGFRENALRASGADSVGSRHRGGSPAGVSRRH